MLDLHLRVSPKDVLIGWYSTGAGITDTDALIHDFFGRECSAPVHLAVDTGFVDEARALRAWVGAPVALGEAVVGTAFSELPVEHAFADADRAGLPTLAAAGGPEATPQPLPNDLAGLDASVQRLHAMLELAHGYADGVVEGRLKPNNAVGRFLADTVAAVPRLSREAFDKLFNDSVQDVLLVMYVPPIGYRAPPARADASAISILPLQVLVKFDAHPAGAGGAPQHAAVALSAACQTVLPDQTSADVPNCR